MKTQVLNFFRNNSIFVRTYIVIILFFLYCGFCNAQDNGITLTYSKTNDSIFLKENTRIKVKTFKDKSFVGKFTIQDNCTIIIDSTAISLDSIIKIKKRTIFSSVVRPIVISTSVMLLSAAVAGALAGGYGLILTVAALPPGLPMLIVPLSTNDHNRKKWIYNISYSK